GPHRPPRPRRRAGPPRPPGSHPRGLDLRVRLHGRRPPVHRTDPRLTGAARDPALPGGVPPRGDPPTRAASGENPDHHQETAPCPFRCPRRTPPRACCSPGTTRPAATGTGRARPRATRWTPP